MRWPYFVTWSGRETSPRARDGASKGLDPVAASGSTFKSTPCVASNSAHGKRRESRGEGHRQDGGFQRWGFRLRHHVARPESPGSVVHIPGRILGRTIVRGLGQGVAVFLRFGDDL